MQELTPRQIVAELDKYIIGQGDAKRAVAVAIRNRWRRQQLPAHIRDEVAPKNIIMIGPTGVGKTEIARRLAGLTHAPFIKVEASKYTEVGYHGRDVESMVRDLLEIAVKTVRDELTTQVQEQAQQRVEERLLDVLLPRGDHDRHPDAPTDVEAEQRRRRTRQKIRAQLRAGALDDKQVEVSVEEKASPIGVFSNVGFEQLDPDFANIFERLMPSRTQTRHVTVAEARQLLFQEEIDNLIDRQAVIRTAIQRTETSGIIFLDELDKICGPESKYGPDVSRQGVQRDLLPIVEGSTVATRHGMIRTDHILFIAAGAFHASKPSDLMPELQGRFPIRVELDDLTKDDFVRILTEPENALTKQQVALLGTEGVPLDITYDAIQAMAEIAYTINHSSQNIGARRLYTVIERVLEQVSFDAPDLPGKKVNIDAAYVRDRLAEIIKEEDLSRFIL